MMTLPELQKKIESGENFSFVKLGDGEILCMLGTEGHNCDGHPYSKELGEALRKAYSFLVLWKNVYLTKWNYSLGQEQKDMGFNGTEDHELLLHNNISMEKYEFYEALKNSPHRKIFIGNVGLADVVRFLDVDIFIGVPFINSFSYPFSFEPKDGDILMFSAGMPAKVWIADTLKKNPNITCIDFGSAFDPIFVRNSRLGQLPMGVLREFYKDLL